MFFIIEQFSPAFMVQANAAHEPACPVVGVSRTFFAWQCLAVGVEAFGSN